MRWVGCLPQWVSAREIADDEEDEDDHHHYYSGKRDHHGPPPALDWHPTSADTQRSPDTKKQRSTDTQMAPSLN